MGFDIIIDTTFCYSFPLPQAAPASTFTLAQFDKGIKRMWKDMARKQTRVLEKPYLLLVLCRKAVITLVSSVPSEEKL